MIAIYKIIDKKQIWIEIDLNINSENRQIECSELDIGIKYQENGKNFLQQITQEDLDSLGYCDSYFDFSLSRQDKENFLIKLNTYRQEHNSINFTKNIKNTKMIKLVMKD